MKKIVYAALASATVLALSACGSSDKASEDAQADTVEMPADEAMSNKVPEPAPDANAANDTAAPQQPAIAEKKADETADASGTDATEAAGAAAAAAAADAAAASASSAAE